MARFYAKFDSGSVSALDQPAAGGYFDRLRIGTGPSNGESLRNGLIDSRSAVSTDVYDDLDAANKDGSKGTYFPPDTPTLPSATTIAWSTAYSSSVDGIKTPVTNTYGVNDIINYSKRPTASVTSTQTLLVGPTDPLDPIQLNYNVYLSASAAAKAVLDSVQYGNGAAQTPYTRPGLNPSRTLHSIWHDPSMSYFAWDDFTPGSPTFYNPTFNGLVDGVLYITSSTSFTIDLQWAKQYQADALGQIDVFYRLALSSSNAEVTKSNATVSNTLSTTVTVSPGSLFNGVGTGGKDPVNYAFTQSAKFYDAIITQHGGTPTTASYSNAVSALRLVSLNDGRIFLATGSAVTLGDCYPLTTPVYGTFAAGSGFPGDNIIGGAYMTSEIEKIYRTLSGPTVELFDPTSSELPGHSAGAIYYVIRATNNTGQAEPAITDQICEYQDGVRTATACASAPLCYEVFDPGVCTSFSYEPVTSLSDCLITPKTVTGYYYSGYGFTTNTVIYTENTCNTILTTEQYIQKDSTNYELSVGGAIIASGAALEC